MNSLDKLISYVAPVTARRRMQSRIMMEHLKGFGNKRRFEGASKGRRTDGWKTPSGTINEILSHDLKTLIDRSRYLTVNNPYAKRGVKAIAAHCVGAGIQPQVTGATKKFKGLLEEWINSTACDVEGRHNLFGIQYLVKKTVVESGSCLVRKRIRPKSWGLPVPLQLQILEPDFLDTSKGIFGIDFDSHGRRTGYWLFEHNPTDPLSRVRTLKSIRVPASDILHIFESHRPGQVTGFPWIAPSILRLNDLADYEDAQLIRQKIAACLVGVITADDGDDPEDDEEDMGLMEPATWKVLPPGQTVTFSNPPQIQGYSDYVVQQLHAISAGLEVPYIFLANDYSRVNFLSGRMALMEFYRSIEHWRWHVLIPQLCVPSFNWFKDVVALAGLASGNPGSSWVPPRREYVDPDTEINGAIKETRAGFVPLSEQIRSRSGDPSKVFDQIAEDNKILDEKGIAVSTDARKEIKPEPPKKSQQQSAA